MKHSKTRNHKNLKTKKEHKKSKEKWERKREIKQGIEYFRCEGSKFDQMQSVIMQSWINFPFLFFVLLLAIALIHNITKKSFLRSPSINRFKEKISYIQKTKINESHSNRKTLLMSNASPCCQIFTDLTKASTVRNYYRWITRKTKYLTNKRYSTKMYSKQKERQSPLFRA